MKIKSFLIFALASFISLSTFSTGSNNQLVSGSTTSDLGKFTINKSKQNISIKESIFDTYIVNYENGNRPIYITIHYTKHCRNFIVRTENFEIQYRCKKNSFGVTTIQAKYASYDTKTNYALINEDEFSRQRIITTKHKTDKELLGLIAYYFPKVIKSQYTKVLI